VGFRSYSFDDRSSASSESPVVIRATVQAASILIAIISPELKCYLVAWEQDQSQDVSAGSIKFYWD
jgi:hypothetical protein